MATSLGFRIRRHISRVDLAKYAGLILWVSILTDVLFVASGNPVGLSPSSARLLIIVSTLSYGVPFCRSRPIISATFECYVVGVYAEILSDFAKSYIIPASFSPVYWGGAGVNDLIFQLGLLMAILYLPSALIPTFVYAVLRRKLGYVSFFIEKLIGKGALEWALKKRSQANQRVFTVPETFATSARVHHRCNEPYVRLMVLLDPFPWE